MRNVKYGIRDRGKEQRGVSLIAAIFIIVVLGFMGVMFLSMIGTSTLTSVNDVQSAQALYVAESGLEVARLQFETGTACGAFANNNIPFGQGTFTTTAGIRYKPNPVTLQAAITAAVTIIPVSADPGPLYAPQGRIRIDDEEITYTGTATGAGNCGGAPFCFTGASRGVAGTTASAHNTVGVPVLQDQCRIQSTGTAGSAQRIAVVDVPGYASAAVAAYLDGQLTSISNAALTNIGSLKTNLSAGDNLIIAVAVFQNTSGVNASINANNLQLRRGAAILAANLSLIHVVGTTVPAANNFPQETQFILYRDAGAPSCPTYDIVAQATANNRISARVKMVVFNNVPNSDFFSGANTALSTAGTGANLLGAAGHQFVLPNATNVILAAVQLDNTGGNNRTINANGLAIRRGGSNGTVLAANAIAIGIEQNGNAREGVGLLLIARDTTPGGANPTYSVTADGNNAIRGQARVLILSGLQSAFYSSGLINPLPTALTSYNFATGLPVGDNIIISASQSYNSEAGTNRNIPTDQLVYGGVISTNITPIYLGTGAQVDDYTTGLILHHTAAPANATYSWQSQSSGGAQVRAETDMVAIHLAINSIPLFGWRELFP